MSILHIYNTKIEPTTETQPVIIYDSCKSLCPTSVLIHFVWVIIFALLLCVFYTGLCSELNVKSTASYPIDCKYLSQISIQNAYPRTVEEFILEFIYQNVDTFHYIRVCYIWSHWTDVHMIFSSKYIVHFK